MANEDSTGPSRLQLQAACVKAGLDSTAGNKELKRMLDVYNKEQGLNTTALDATATTTLTSSVLAATDMEQDEDTKMDLDTKVEVKEEEVAGDEDVEVKEEIMDVKEETIEASLSVKSALTGPFHAPGTDGAVEALSGDTLSLNGIKLEQDHEEDGGNEDMSVKQEIIKEELQTEEAPEEDIQIKPEEEKSLPISKRKQFWESKLASSSSSPASTPRSGQRPRVASQLPTRIPRTPAITRPALQKRLREDDETDVKEELKEPGPQTNRSSPASGSILPAPGSVRKLIGKFASPSSPSPSTPKSISPAPNAFMGPSASKKPRLATTVRSPPARKRIIKIPVARATRPASGPSEALTLGSKSSTTETAAPGSSSGPRKRATISVTSPRVKRVIVATKVTTSATINRLATPKKINHAQAPSSSHQATASASALGSPPTSASTLSTHVVPTTPTRPRGPVLSTASRAAQRSSKGR